MNAILVREFGGPEVLKLEELPDARPGPDEVLVRIQAVGVNPYDTYMRTGNYATRPTLPYIPGADAAGFVAGVGSSVRSVREGDHVYIGGTVAGKNFGAYAGAAVCRADQVHPLPSRISFQQGAAVNVPYVTAWHALHNRARIQPGETLFIHGASGGVGMAALQIARAWGLTVIGTASSPDGRELLRKQGVRHTLNHHDPGYLEEVKTLTGGRGPDVIFESLANVNLDNDLSLIAQQGRVLIIGNRGRIEIDPRKIMHKDSTVLGMAMWNLGGDMVARIHDGIVAGLESGALTPVVARELPLAQAALAHNAILEPGAKGKIVLIP